MSEQGNALNAARLDEISDFLDCLVITTVTVSAQLPFCTASTFEIRGAIPKASPAILTRLSNCDLPFEH